jgi:tetratricopeptide (TPR) repeat protein
VFAYTQELDAWLHSGSHTLANDHTNGSSTFDISALADAFQWCSEENLLKLIEECRNAVMKHCSDAYLWGVLAGANVMAIYADILPAVQILPRAEKAINKALMLNPHQPHALAADGCLAMFRNDLEFAARRFKESLSESQCSAVALVGFSIYSMLTGNYDETRELSRRVKSMVPYSPLAYYACARIDYYMGDYDQVIEQFSVLRNYGEDSPGFRVIAGLSYLFTEQRELALDLLKQSADVFPKSAVLKGALGYAHASCEHNEKAIEILFELSEKYTHSTAKSYAAALVCQGLKRFEEALVWLGEDGSCWSGWNLFLMRDRAFAGLKEDKRFCALLKRYSAYFPDEDRHLGSVLSISHFRSSLLSEKVVSK